MLVYCTSSIVGFWWNVNFHAWLAVLHDVFSVLFSQIQLQSETVQKLQLPEAMQSFANGVQALHISSGWMNFLWFPLWLKVPGTSRKGRVWIQRICWRRLHMHSHGMSWGYLVVWGERPRIGFVAFVFPLQQLSMEWIIPTAAPKEGNWHVGLLPVAFTTLGIAILCSACVRWL